MPRDVAEWIGRTDNSMPSDGCKRRILDRQNNLCALTGAALRTGHVDFDHIVPLWLGGENRETNLQAVTKAAHAGKTKAEATVRAKINRQKLKNLGVKGKRKGRGFGPPHLSKRMNGDVIDTRTGEIVSEGRP